LLVIDPLEYNCESVTNNSGKYQIGRISDLAQCPAYTYLGRRFSKNGWYQGEIACGTSENMPLP